MIIPAHPLQWPAGWKRTPAHQRGRAMFGKQRTVQSSHVNFDGSRNSWKTKCQVTIAEGVDRVRSSLVKMGIDADDLVINSNLKLRLDGLPRSDQREPADPGIAVYWRDRGETRCMAIDRYDRVADNLAAIAATIEAMRAIERHGGAAILDRAFTGFAALPGPADVDWRAVLHVTATARLADAEAAYRRLRSSCHPDHGGSAEAFQQLQDAIAAARRELGAMTGTRFFHMSLNVRGALKHWKPRDFRGVFSDNGRTLSVDEAKDRLLDELAKGHKLIPCCDDSACPEFDRTGGGCPGHDREPLRSPSECIDSCGSGEPCDPAACPLPAPTP